MITPQPLVIVQARMGSTRLPGKVLLPVGGMPLVIRVWRQACLAVGASHTVVAIPATEENEPLRDVLYAHKAQVFAYGGAENDVLGRFYHCAHHYRWHPDTVILRVTPDDPWKSAAGMQRVLAGERLPVEIGGEAFTLAMLDVAEAEADYGVESVREHIGRCRVLFPTAAPEPPSARAPWSIDTREDYDAVLAALEDHWPASRWEQEGEL